MFLHLWAKTETITAKAVNNNTKDKISFQIIYFYCVISIYFNIG
jgi:hypothetical protein